MDFDKIRAELQKCESSFDILGVKQKWRKKYPDMSMAQDHAFRAIVSQAESRLLAEQWGFRKKAKDE